jgi:hypothetical protein
MKTTMRFLRPSLCLCVCALLACADKKPSSSPQIPLTVDFPSTAAAVLTQEISYYVFDGTPGCLSLITTVDTMGQLPGNVFQASGVSPCDLYNGAPDSTFSLPIGSSDQYTVLVVGEVNGNPQLAGCAVEDSFGTTMALPVSLTFIDNKQVLGTTKCTALSTFCSGGCQ